MSPVRGGPPEKGDTVFAQQLNVCTGYRPAGLDGLNEDLMGVVGVVLDHQAEVRYQDQPLIRGIVNRLAALFVPPLHRNEKQAIPLVFTGQVTGEIQRGVVGLAGMQGLEVEDIPGKSGDVRFRKIGIGEVGVPDITAGLGDQMGDLPGQQPAHANFQGRQPPGHDPQALLAGKGQYGPFAGQLNLAGVCRGGHHGIVK